MRTLLPVGIVVALLAIAAGWLLADDVAPPLQQPPNAAATAASATLASAAAITQAPADASAATGAPEREAVTVPGTARLVHTLRGRAVDAAGRPLADIAAHLVGQFADDQRVAAWTRRNPDPDAIDQRVTTGADGVFTFACWPPPPFRYSLRLQGHGLAAWSQRWSEWIPGRTTDLGDVKLERGTLVRGRVVDTGGAPIAKAEVSIDAVDSASIRRGFETACAARTRNDGSFVQAWPVLPGEYTIRVANEVIERGTQLTLLADDSALRVFGGIENRAQVTLSGEPEQIVDIVVRGVDPADSVRGVVVDERGAPIPDVTIQALESGKSSVYSTDDNGRFRVRRQRAASTEVTLYAGAPGFSPPVSTEKCAWGRHDVRLVLMRGKDLEVRVLADTDSSSVEDFVLRVIPASGGHHAKEHRPHGKPPHREGRAIARGIAIGKHRVVVTPREDPLAIGTMPIEVGPNGAPSVTVRLAAAQPRVVRVITVGGSPVTGANVRLVDPCGERCRVGMSPYAADGLYAFTPSKAIELAAATTDANGECTLPAPIDRALALLLPGPGHIAMAVDPVVFPAAGPLVVTVGRGASLRGKLGPDAAWAELVQLAGGPEAGSRRRPTVSVTRGERGKLESFPKTRHAVDEDGSFELTGIPAGRWNASLSYNAGPSGAWKVEALGVVDLVDGQVTTIAPDLSGLLSGTIEALVLRDGAPFADVHVLFSRLVAGESRPQSEEGVKTDVDGRATARVRTGQYVVTWEPPSNDGTYMVLRSTEVADVRPGETTRQTFTIASGTVRVRLLDSAGNPVPRVQINLTDIAGTGPSALGTTRPDGRADRLLPAGTFDAFVLPRRLQDEQASRQFHRAVTDPAQRAAVNVPLGSFTVRSGQTTELELKLPADW